MRDILEAEEKLPELAAEVAVAEVELYPLFRRGFLYNAIAEQPSRYVAYMREIDDARSLAQKKYEELTAPPEGSSEIRRPV